MAELSTPTNIGIDVSKDWLDISVLPTQQTWRIANTEEDIQTAIPTLKALQPERIVLEATGGYENRLALQLYAAGLPVVRVNPKRVRYFARSLGLQAKNRCAGWQGLGALCRTGQTAFDAFPFRKRAIPEHTLDAPRTALHYAGG